MKAKRTPEWLYDDNNYADRIADHEEARLTTGVSTLDTWNLDQYISQVIVNGLKILRDNSHGHPTDFKDLAAWNKTLDKIIEGYTLHLEDKLDGTVEDESQPWGHRLDLELREANIKKFKTAQRLFNKYYLSLWD